MKKLTDRERAVNVMVHDAIGWDDRKRLAETFQHHARLAGCLTDEFYEALIAVAQYGARRVAEEVIE